MQDKTLPVDPAASPVSILIVDDEPKNLTVLESVLDDPGYRLVRATSGEQALLALMAEEFAVLVLDVRMPGMTGFELAQMIKERKKTSRVPIIFLTAYYNEDQHILEGYVAGAVDYLHKPVNPAVLRSKVGVFAELHRKGLALAAANQLLLGEVSERRKAEAQLSALAQTLDQRVQSRTEELMASEARLLEAGRRKDEFLATLAHELRNPLAPVRNAVELIRRKPGDVETVVWSANLINRQVTAFARLIDDLMDVSRITRGRVELKKEVLSLDRVLRDAVEAVRPLADAARHELAVMLPDSTIAVHGDATRLAQAFTNLLNNAVKYTDPGGRIELYVVVEKDVAVVTVRDNGIGIPPSQLDVVFEMFAQIESALERSRGGLGIGLSLTKKLIELHGGSIRAHSDGDKRGSRFQVTLPLAHAAAPAVEASPPVADACPPMRVLIADDNVDAARTLAMVLEQSGQDVRVAHDGQEAVALAGTFDPDVVILDIGMPRMNGFEAARHIRSDPGGRRRTLIALTGWGQDQDVKRAMESGFDSHLVKPADIGALLAILQNAVRGAATDAPAAARHIGTPK